MHVINLPPYFWMLLRVKNRYAAEQVTFVSPFCPEMNVCMLFSRSLYRITLFTENWILTKSADKFIKKGFSAKISSMKNQHFYTIKIASTKATVWLENDFAIFGNRCAVQSI